MRRVGVSAVSLSCPKTRRTCLAHERFASSSLRHFRQLGRNMNPRALRVLVVDDVRDQADTLSLLLQLWGYETLVAYDGPRALQVSEDHRPDVVLLDIGL